MRDTRVLRSRIGQMPGPPALALACALQARRLRHVLACNCGMRHDRCTGIIKRTPEQERMATLTNAELRAHVARFRRVLHRYRTNRTWPEGRKIPPKQG